MPTPPSQPTLRAIDRSHLAAGIIGAVLVLVFFAATFPFILNYNVRSEIKSNYYVFGSNLKINDNESKL